MQITTKTHQCNFILDIFFLDYREINNLLKKREIFYVENGKPCYNPIPLCEFDLHQYRISTEDLLEIDVIADTLGYRNVATHKNGNKYVVML